MRASRACVSLVATTLVVSLAPAAAHAQGHPTSLALTRASASELRAWDDEIGRMIRSRELRPAAVEADTLVPGRQHERLDQYYRGVRVSGGDLTRQTGPDGTVSLFGVLHTGVDVDVAPRLSTDDARDAIAAAVNGTAFGAGPELVVLPLSDGYHLAYSGQATSGLEIVNVFVDANSGVLLRQYSDFLRDGAVGAGTGTYGDKKKISVTPLVGAFVADDTLRPADITTYDMKGNLTRTSQILGRQASVTTADVASDADNNWTDGTVVDAHVYAGWYYDYLFKRFGRSGIDGRNLRMALFTHTVRLEDIATASASVIGTYYVNAFSCATCGPDGRGAVVLGEGAPRGFFANVEVKSFAAALDVVAHELTHNVTSSTARLNGFPYSEAGSLNEAFSDIFGVSTAFFFDPAGSGPLQASYLQGKDLTVPSGVFARSMSNPASTRDPDHYTQRDIGGDPHANGTIVGHTFYLAIEGGTNGTSGLSVQGVGAANREQIEKVFFRALTLLLPSNATFGLVRQTTIQAARDLYGAGSAPERAATQAWDAVGVQERTVPTAALLPNPATSTTSLCAGSAPSWVLGITVSAGSANLRTTGWEVDLFDGAGATIERTLLSPVQFTQLFNQCGPGSDRILAQTDACSAVCVALDGRTSGSAQATFTTVDDAGQTLTFSTARVALRPR